MVLPSQVLNVGAGNENVFERLSSTYKTQKGFDCVNQNSRVTHTGLSCLYSAVSASHRTLRLLSPPLMGSLGRVPSPISLPPLCQILAARVVRSRTIVRTRCAYVCIGCTTYDTTYICPTQNEEKRFMRQKSG